MTKFQILILRFRMRPGALERAKRKADLLHKKTGWRYRVFFFGNKYHVWTRNDIRDRKKSGLFKFFLKAGKDFDRVSFYDTGSVYGQSCCKS
jgi:hypothetical protein